MRKWAALASGAVVSFPCIAGICDVAWDGEKVTAAIAGRPAQLQIPLRDKQKNETRVTVGEIQAFEDARQRIGQVSGIAPKFIICGGDDPNAFASKGKNGD